MVDAVGYPSVSWTYYDVLDVDPDADTERLRAAYRERVKEVHPDVSDHPDAEARFRAVSRAREVLCDPTERARYDRLGHERYVSNADHSEGPPGAARATQDAWAGDTEPSDPSSSPTDGAGNARSTNSARRRARRAARRRADARASMGDSAHSTRAGQRANAATTGRASRRPPRSAPDTGGARRGSGYRTSTRSTTTWSVTAGRTALAAASLVCYPGLLAGAFLAPAPVGFRALAGIAALLLVVVTLTVPEAAVIVFSVLTVAAPIVLAIVGISLVSVAGALAWAFCWIPLVVAVGTMFALRT